MWVFVVVVVVGVGTIENQKSQGGKGTGGAREYLLWMRGRRPSGRGAWIPLPLVLVRKKWRDTWVTFRDQPLGQGPPERRESSDQLKKWLLLHCLHTLNRSASLLLYLLLLFVFLFVFLRNIIFFSLMLFGLCAVVFYKRFSLPFFFIMKFFIFLVENGQVSIIYISTSFWDLWVVKDLRLPPAVLTIKKEKLLYNIIFLPLAIEDSSCCRRNYFVKCCTT